MSVACGRTWTIFVGPRNCILRCTADCRKLCYSVNGDGTKMFAVAALSVFVSRVLHNNTLCVLEKVVTSFHMSVHAWNMKLLSSSRGPRNYMT